jgi:hypothetical protein
MQMTCTNISPTIHAMDISVTPPLAEIAPTLADHVAVVPTADADAVDQFPGVQFFGFVHRLEEAVFFAEAVAIELGGLDDLGAEMFHDGLPLV